MIYPNVEKLLEIHNKLIETSLENNEVWSFGFLWWKNTSDLESVIEFIKSDDYYPNLEDKITHLMFSINKNHLFKDGNKRSCVYFSAYFLFVNNFDCKFVENFIRKFEDVSVQIANNTISKNELKTLIKKCL